MIETMIGMFNNNEKWDYIVSNVELIEKKRKTAEWNDINFIYNGSVM